MVTVLESLVGSKAWQTKHTILGIGWGLGYRPLFCLFWSHVWQYSEVASNSVGIKPRSLAFKAFHGPER